MTKLDTIKLLNMTRQVLHDPLIDMVSEICFHKPVLTKQTEYKIARQYLFYVQSRLSREEEEEEEEEEETLFDPKSANVQCITLS